MTQGRKYDTLRAEGIEILRVCKELRGFEGTPKRIADFYESLAESAFKGAMENLKPLALSELDKAREEGARSLAFFRRYNYLIECEASADEELLRVTVSVRLTRAANELYYVKNVHFWNTNEESMIGENGLKKALSRRG